MNAPLGFSTTLPLMTADEFVERYPNHRVELIKGFVKELPMPLPKHGKICLRIGSYLMAFADLHDLGHVMSNDSFVRVRSNPDTVLGPDVSFYSYERLPKGAVPEGLLESVPDLVVEVRSPSNTWTELYSKVADYLAAGVRAVVVIDDATATASVYRRDVLQHTFSRTDQLTLPEILPGFSLLVGKLFE